jgi:Tol biopolymer transport system component
MAYMRSSDPEPGKYRLLSANLDGSDEKVLLIAPVPAPDSLAWSPDGKGIAYISYADAKAPGQISVLDLASGKDAPLTAFPDRKFFDLAWLTDGRGLLVNYVDRASSSTNRQIGFVSYPGGRFQSLTNDIHGYQTVSVSADGKFMVSTQEQETDSVHVLTATGNGSAVQVPGLPNQAIIRGLDWDSHGNLIVTTAHSMLRLSSDGSQQTTLLSDPSATMSWTSVCRNGGPILFTWYFREGETTTNIWRVDPDGSHPKQLTTGNQDITPLCSPDGKWAYYTDGSSFRIKKVPIDGGTPELVEASAIYGFMTGGVNFSSDGKWMPEIAVYASPGAQANSYTYAPKIALVDLNANSSASTKFLTLHHDTGNLMVFSPNEIGFIISFTPDGKGLAYKTVENGVSNIWVQPLDGSSPHRLTNFTSDRILTFQFAPDGKSLAVAQQHIVSDVVLLRDTAMSAR